LKRGWGLSNLNNKIYVYIENKSEIPGSTNHKVYSLIKKIYKKTKFNSKPLNINNRCSICKNEFLNNQIFYKNINLPICLCIDCSLKNIINTNLTNIFAINKFFKKHINYKNNSIINKILPSIKNLPRIDRRTIMGTKLYKDGRNMSIVTNCDNEVDFIDEVSKILADKIAVGEFIESEAFIKETGVHPNDWEFQFQAWLRCFIEICMKYRNYKANVFEHRVLAAGSLSAIPEEDKWIINNEYTES
jgi:hypothetical protein